MSMLKILFSSVWVRAIFEWPWKMVSVSVRYCFISQWMKRSKHRLFVFPPKKTLTWRRHCSIGQSCCSMTSKRSTHWFLESSRAWSFFHPRIRLTNQNPRAFVSVRWTNQIALFPFACCFILFARFHFKIIRKSLYWAKQWLSFCFLITDRKNKANLEAIEKAVFVLCLDQPPPHSTQSPSVMENPTCSVTARQSLHGDGTEYNSCNRWFDKIVQVPILNEGSRWNRLFWYIVVSSIQVVSIRTEAVKLHNNFDHIIFFIKYSLCMYTTTWEISAIWSA